MNKLTYQITGPHAGGAYKINLLDSGRTVAICDSKQAAEGVNGNLNAINRGGIALINAATTPPEETEKK